MKGICHLNYFSIAVAYCLQYFLFAKHNKVCTQYELTDRLTCSFQNLFQSANVFISSKVKL